MSHRIPVPLNGSRLAELALGEALIPSQVPDLNGVLLQVIAPIKDVISDGETFTVDQQWENKVTRAREYLARICERPQGRKTRHEVVVETGDPAIVILEFAQKHAIDRIVPCSHGRTGVSKWVHRSVAHKVPEAAARTAVLVRAGQPKGA